MQTAYLLPLMVFALVLVVAAFGLRASRRRGYGPFVLGVAAAAGLVVGKFVVRWDLMVSGSVAALPAASLWNTWPKRTIASAATETLLQLGSIKEKNEHGYERQD